jgi:hypothetical protein
MANMNNPGMSICYLENSLEILGLMLDDYENKHYPIEAPDPIEAIKIRMEEMHLACIIHKLSITMFNYLQNTSVLIKFDLKIVHYSLLQICLRVLVFFDI